MTQTDVSNLATRAAEADKALREAEATAKALKAQLKAERPSQMSIVRRAVIDNEAITVDDLMAELATRGYSNAQKGIIQGLRSDAISFLRLLRDMGRLVEKIEPEAEPQQATSKRKGKDAPTQA